MARVDVVVGESSELAASVPIAGLHNPDTTVDIVCTITLTATDGAGNTSTRSTSVSVHNADECFG